MTEKSHPLLSLYPGIKEARPGYTMGYNSGYARVYPTRSDYTSLNDISKLGFSHQNCIPAKPV